MLSRTLARVVLMLSLALLALCAIGLAHTALDARGWLLLGCGAAGLILLPLSANRLRANASRASG